MSKKKHTPADEQMFKYPDPPYTVGLEWVEWQADNTADLASALQAHGFERRSPVDDCPRLAIGGTVLVLRSSTASPHAQGKTLLLQLVVNDIDRKHAQLCAMGFELGEIERQPRGDMAFQWRHDSGLTLRYVGPLRRPDDPVRE